MKKITSVCPYCGAGCKLKLVVENNKIIRAEGAEGVTNQNQLCLKGYYGWDFLNDTRLLTPRLTRPMIRYQKGGKFTPVSWDEAIRYTAQRLSAIKETFGPRAIMTTGSSRGQGMKPTTSCRNSPAPYSIPTMSIAAPAYATALPSPGCRRRWVMGR